MENSKELDLSQFEMLSIGESFTVEHDNVDEVRKALKKEYPSTGHRILEIGDGIICIVRTQGRVSKKKQEILNLISEMHPFKRVHIAGGRLEYVRSIINDYNKENGDNLQARQIDEHSPVEMFRDPFDKTYKVSQGYTDEQLTESFKSVMGFVDGSLFHNGLGTNEEESE